MRFGLSLAAGLAVAIASVASLSDAPFEPLHRLLHASPPLSSGSISMYPSRHPAHNGTDLNFLIPRLSRELYFAQEGHRKAIHGSKHAQLKATFRKPTVVLDQSDHLKSIKCSDNLIQVCFRNPEARDTVEKSWIEDTYSEAFYLITYHRGCGDLTGHKRSYFVATQPIQSMGEDCLSVSVQPIDEHDALESGEFSWGVYDDPQERSWRASDAGGHRQMVSAGETPETVDIDDDLLAADAFFNTTSIRPNYPGPNDPIEFVHEDGTVDKRDASILPRGSMSSIVYQGLHSAFQTAKGWVKESWKIIGRTMIIYAVNRAHGDRYSQTIDRSFHHHYHIDHFLPADSSDTGPVVLGEAGYLVYHGKGTGSKDPGGGSGKFEKGVRIACVKCGIQGDFTVSGRFVFDAIDGIRKGNIVVDAAEDTKLYAHIGIKVGGKYPIAEYEEQIAATALSPISVPGLFIIGPELSFSAALNLDLAGEAELIVGGDVTLSPGRAILDLKEESGCKIENGMVPSFEPVARASGRLEAIAAVGLPIGLEFGVDVLNGKFKGTVGLINTPSVYLSASVSFGAGSPCDDGVELRLGSRNTIEISALKLWSLQVLSLALYDRGLGCVTQYGFDKDRVQPDETSIFEFAREKLVGDGQLYVDAPTPFRDFSSRLGTSKQHRHWSVIMDREETSILLSGSDGYVYLAKPEERNELAEAWGTTEPLSGFYALDAFGQILSYDKQQYERNELFMVEVRLSDTKNVPKNHLFALFTVLHNEKDPPGPLAVFLGGLEHVRYPTFCKVEGEGLRLYATEYVVDKDGKVWDDDDKEYEGADEIFAQMGLNKADCRTVNLFSSESKPTSS